MNEFIFLKLEAGCTEMSLPEGANCTVSDLRMSGFEAPENMALGNKLAKSINSPRIMRSLMRGGTGGKD